MACWFYIISFRILGAGSEDHHQLRHASSIYGLAAIQNLRSYSARGTEGAVRPWQVKTGRVAFLVRQMPVLGMKAQGLKMPLEIFEGCNPIITTPFLHFSSSPSVNPHKKKKTGHCQLPASCSTQSYLFHAPRLSPDLPQL